MDGQADSVVHGFYNAQRCDLSAVILVSSQIDIRAVGGQEWRYVNFNADALAVRIWCEPQVLYLHLMARFRDEIRVIDEVEIHNIIGPVTRQTNKLIRRNSALFAP